MWNKKFQFDISVPELALVRFLLEDHDTASQNDFIGQYCLPLTSVQNGKKAHRFDEANTIKQSDTNSELATIQFSKRLMTEMVCAVIKISKC